VLAHKLRQLEGNAEQSFLVQNAMHVMVITLKKKDAQYSVSVWDPNRPEVHTKMRFASIDDVHEKKPQFLDFFTLKQRFVFMTGAKMLTKFFDLDPSRKVERFACYKMPSNWYSEYLSHIL
jgi:hypothetical protein